MYLLFAKVRKFKIQLLANIPYYYFYLLLQSLSSGWIMTEEEKDTNLIGWWLGRKCLWVETYTQKR